MQSMQKVDDNARRPMQWNDEKCWLFSQEVDPWLSVNPNYKDINVENALADPNSFFILIKIGLNYVMKIRS